MFNDAGQMLAESYAGGPLNGVSMTNDASGSKRKVEWTFDGLGRRIGQIEYVGSLSTTNYQLSTGLKTDGVGSRWLAVSFPSTGRALLL